MRRVALLSCLMLVTAAAFAQSTANDDSCDIMVAPAATLLLPRFEVDLVAPPELALTTLFTITNVTRRPQIARVTIWTDWAYPLFAFNVFLTGYDVQAINLRDVLVGGIITPTSSGSTPGRRSLSNIGGNPHFLPTAAANCASMAAELPRATLNDLRFALTVGIVPSCGTPRVGGTHTNAIGYVTIDVVADCTSRLPSEPLYHVQELLYDNVLIGDYQIVDPRLGQAAAESMVHIRAVPEGGPAGLPTATNLPYTFYDRYTPPAIPKFDRRQPLPSSFAARFVDDPGNTFFTDFHIWREGVTRSGAACSAYITNARMTVADMVRFDERENPTVYVRPPFVLMSSVPMLPAAVRVASRNTSLLPPLTAGDGGGWMYFNLHNNAARTSQNWVSVSMYGIDRFHAFFDAAALANGCAGAADLP